MYQQVLGLAKMIGASINNEVLNMTIVEFGTFRLAAIRLALVSDDDFAISDGFQYWVELLTSSEPSLLPPPLEVPLEVA